MHSSSEQLLVYGQKPAASVGTVIVREAVQPRPSTANPQRVWETCHADQSYKVNKRVRNIYGHVIGSNVNNVCVPVRSIQTYIHINF